jgi:hypothetical protein
VAQARDHALRILYLAKQLEALLVQLHRMPQIAPAHRYHPLEHEQVGQRVSVLEPRLELPEHRRQGYVVPLPQHRDQTEVGESGCDALIVLKLPVDDQRLLYQGLRRPLIPLIERQPCGAV